MDPIDAKLAEFLQGKIKEALNDDYPDCEFYVDEWFTNKSKRLKCSIFTNSKYITEHIFDIEFINPAYSRKRENESAAELLKHYLKIKINEIKTFMKNQFDIDEINIEYRTDVEYKKAGATIRMESTFEKTNQNEDITLFKKEDEPDITRRYSNGRMIDNMCVKCHTLFKSNLVFPKCPKCNRFSCPVTSFKITCEECGNEYINTQICDRKHESRYGGTYCPKCNNMNMEKSTNIYSFKKEVSLNPTFCGPHSKKYPYEEIMKGLEEIESKISNDQIIAILQYDYKGRYEKYNLEFIYVAKYIQFNNRMRSCHWGIAYEIAKND